MKRLAILLVVVVLLLVAGSALAMSSANYSIEWMVPLTGGGGEASSANYKINLTVGQTVIGSASSANYRACLGYWCGTEGTYQLFLPLTVK